MATPEFKVFDAQGEYQAAVRHIEDAAVLVASWSGGTIRWGHSVIVWTEGGETQPAGESFDFVVETAITRLRERARVRAARDGYRTDVSVLNRYLPPVARFGREAYEAAIGKGN